MLTVTVDLTVHNQVLDGTAAVLEQTQAVATLALDGDLVALAVERALVSIGVAVTNGHVVASEVDVSRQLGVDFGLTVVDQVGECLELGSRSNHVGIGVGVGTILQVNLSILLLEGKRNCILTNHLPEIDFLLLAVQLVANFTAAYLIPSYLEGTLSHVVEVVLTIAATHHLVGATYIEKVGNTLLAYIICIADGATNGMNTITADHVGGNLVTDVGIHVAIVLNFHLTDHQTVGNLVVGVVVPAYEAADTVLTLDLTCIDTVDQLRVCTAHVTQDTTATDVGVARAGDVHVGDTVLDAQTLTSIAHDTAVVLTVTVDLTVHNQVLDGTAAVLEQTQAVATLALDGDLVALTVQRTLVGMFVAVTDGHVIACEVDIGRQLGVDGGFTVVDAVSVCLELTGGTDIEETVLVGVAVLAVNIEDGALSGERYREFVSANRLGEAVALPSFLVHLVADFTAFQLLLGYLEGTLSHVAGVVLTVAVAHHLAQSAYVEGLRHTSLLHVIGVAD